MSCYQCGDKAPLVYKSRCIKCLFNSTQKTVFERKNDDLRDYNYSLLQNTNHNLREDIKQLRIELEKTESYVSLRV